MENSSGYPPFHGKAVHVENQRCIIASTTYLICLHLTICSSTAICLRRQKRPHAGKLTVSSSSSLQKGVKTQPPTLKTESKKSSGSMAGQQGSAQQYQPPPLARTQEEEDKKAGEGEKSGKPPPRTPTKVLLSDRVRQTLPTFSPLTREKDEGCDDYLNALGESSDREQLVARTQFTQTETPTLNALPKKKKKKKAVDSSKFVRNTMDNIPTIT